MSLQVLIVDDSEQSATTLEIVLLAIPGVVVTRFSSALQALRFLQAEGGAGVRALITDLNMPAMDGFELIRQVRGDRRFTRIPILVLSADTDPLTPERTRELGADAFFPKPFSPLQVKKKVEELLHEPA